MFHATTTTTIIIINYDTALCGMLQARPVMLTGWYFLTQQSKPLACNILLQQASERESESYSFSSHCSQ
jgi:hypothetical protein